MPISHAAIHAEHQARVAMSWGQRAFDNAPPAEPESEAEAEAEDMAEAMSRNPSIVADWMSDFAGTASPADRVVPFAELLAGPQTFEGLMTALIGGTAEQGIAAMYRLREQFAGWALERADEAQRREAIKADDEAARDACHG